MPTAANSINESTTGICGFTGTAFTGSPATQHAVQIGSSTTSTLSSIAVGTNGQVLIAATTADPAFATLTSTNGTIAFTTGANTLNLDVVGGGFTWVDATGATQALLAQHGYVTDHSATVVYTLPASGTLGDVIKIVGKLGLATITPNANQQILIGSASGSVGITGTAVSQNVGDCIELVCITAGASTVWRADSIIGTWVLT